MMQTLVVLLSAVKVIGIHENGRCDNRESKLITWRMRNPPPEPGDGNRKIVCVVRTQQTNWLAPNIVGDL